MSLLATALQTGAGTDTGVNVVVLGPLLVSLATAVFTLLVGDRLRRPVSLVGVLGYAGAVAVLADRVFGGTTMTYQLSNWAAPFGITAVADPLSAFMLCLAAAVAVPALAYSVVHVDDFGQRLSYHPLFHFMLVGVSGAFLTGDVFNLFVWFEVMLMSSYVLVVFYSGPQHTKAALQYVVLNLVASALMLLAIGGLYATTGTLNMADMARRLADPAAFGVTPAPVLGLSAVLFAVFALKAGIVPFQFWVPGAYRAAPAPVAAVLAGVVKKVGIYAIVRLYFTVFDAATMPVSLPGIGGDSALAFFGPVLFVMATASILLGGVGAVARERFDDVLSYSSIGQVGFIVLPLAFAAAAGDPAKGAVVDPAGPFSSLRALAIAGALVYSLNHALAKAALFLASGAVGESSGTDSLSGLGGLAERAPMLSGAVFVAGVALVGVPPVLGFFGKFFVFDAAYRSGSSVGLAVALGGAVLTIAYFTRAWNRGFWGEPGESVVTPPRTETAVVVVLALALLVVGVGFDPIAGAAQAAAEAAVDRAGYVDAVDPQEWSGSGTGSKTLDGTEAGVFAFTDRPTAIGRSVRNTFLEVVK